MGLPLRSSFGGAGSPGGSLALGDPPATPVTGDDGGAAYSTPGNLPVFAFRQDGDDHDRFTIWSDGNMYWGDGTAPPSVNMYFDYDDEGNIRIDGGNGVNLDNKFIFDYATGRLTMTGPLHNSSGEVILTNLPIADPAEAGQLWSDSGVLTVSSG